METHDIDRGGAVGLGPQIEIRRMEICHLEKVAGLEAAIFSDPWPRDSLKHELVDNHNSYKYVLLNNQSLAGYAIYWYYDGEAHLVNFAIDAKFRRRHLGDMLLHYVLKDMTARKATEAWLEVRPSNREARRLYEKHGFRAVGLRENYYSNDKENAILMSLFLKEGS